MKFTAGACVGEDLTHGGLTSWLLPGGNEEVKSCISLRDKGTRDGRMIRRGRETLEPMRFALDRII